MQNFGQPLREKDLQKAVADYLQYAQNQGKLYYTRLNSGSAFVKRGNKFYKIQLCEKGTADFFVLTSSQSGLSIPRIIFLELKAGKRKQEPEQKEFQRLIENFGAEYCLVRSIEELQKLLENRHLFL